MFFENLETRQMFSVTIPSTVLTLPKPPIIASLNVVSTATAATATTKATTVNAPTSLVTTPAPTRSTVLKPGATAILAGAVQGAIDPNSLGKSPVGSGTTTMLPGGLTLSQNPFDRPSAADVAGANAFRSALTGLLANSAMQSLLAQYGKSLDQMGNVGSGTDPSARPDFLSLVMADMQAQTGVGKAPGRSPGGIDSRYADDVSGGLGINPTDAEVAAAIKAREAKDSGTPAPATTTTPPAAAPSATDTAKSLGAKILDYAKDVVFEKFGPPGPWTTILGAPDYVEKVTGDSKDLLNGFKAIFQSGSKNPNMPKESPDPNGDVVLEPQQQKVIDQAMAFFGRFLNLTPTLHDLGTSLISQPVRQGDGSTVPTPDRNTITNGGQAPAKDMSPYINPGSGDDGTAAATAGTPTGPLKAKAVVKDPAKPDSGIDSPVFGPAPSNGMKPAGGGTASPGSTPTTAR